MAGELENLEYRFLDYIRSLEALLGDQNEITHKLASRTSALIGGSSDERLNTYDFIKGAYKCRSQSVHGERLPPLKFRRWNGTIRCLGMMEEIDILHWYCRQSVRRIINVISEISRSATLAAKWKEMSDRQKKDWIIGLLDYSLVSHDLGEASQAFYSKSLDIETLWAKYKKSPGNHVHTSIIL